MPTKTFTLTLTDDVAAATLAPANASEFNRQVIADRTRTIDQIKRLYAVVMGFAVTQCFIHIYQCVQSVGLFSSYGLVLFAQGIAFLTLIVLFYLGAERLLDTRYLKIENRVPHRLDLLLDIFTSGATAIWFVILADTFADPASIKSPDTLEHQISIHLHYFTANLLLLYFVDSIFLLIQIFRMRLHPTSNYDRNIQHHWVWFGLNVLGILFFYPVVVLFPENQLARAISYLVWDIEAIPFQNDVFLASYIIILHVGRFIFDYWFAYESYYPPEELV